MAATTAMQTTQHQTVHDNTTLKRRPSTLSVVRRRCPQQPQQTTILHLTVIALHQHSTRIIMAATTAMQTTQHQTVHDNTTLKLYDSAKQLIYPICHCTCSILHHINTPNTAPSSDQMCQTLSSS